MTTCILDEKGQLWGLLQNGSKIRHRGLDKCIEACTTDRCFVTLQNCSSTETQLQAWSIVSETDHENDDNIHGDFVCLKYNRSLCLSSQFYDDDTQDDYLLSVKVFNQSKQWTALLISGYRIPLDKMNDCVFPWVAMKDYRGTRYF